jgi:hypothetical protein
VDYGVKNFKYVDSHSDQGLVYAYGTGSYTTNSGSTFEGFFGLLVNSDIKKKTFFFAFMVPSMKTKDTYNSILDIVDNMVPME